MTLVYSLRTLEKNNDEKLRSTASAISLLLEYMRNIGKRRPRSCGSSRCNYWENISPDSGTTCAPKLYKQSATDTLKACYKRHPRPVFSGGINKLLRLVRHRCPHALRLPVPSPCRGENKCAGCLLMHLVDLTI